MGNENEVKNLNEKEVNEVAGGADTSRDERIKKAIEDFASNLPKFYYETHEVKCRWCRQPMKVYGDDIGIPICSDCRASRSMLDRMEKLKQEIEKSKQIPTASETKN